MPDWYDDGYLDDNDFDDDDLIAEEPAEPEPKPPTVICCKHCGSHRLRLRSSDGDTTIVKFQCGQCNKMTSIDLPFGYTRCYVVNEWEE